MTPQERLARIEKHLREIALGGSHPNAVVLQREDAHWLYAIATTAMSRSDDPDDQAVSLGLIENVRDGGMDITLDGGLQVVLRVTEAGARRARRLLGLAPGQEIPREELDERVRRVIRGEDPTE